MKNYKLKITLDEIEFTCIGDYCTAENTTYDEEPIVNDYDLQEVKHKSENIINFLDDSTIEKLEIEIRKELFNE